MDQTNIKKLNNTIDELEKSASEFISINKTLSEVESLYKEVSAASESYIEIKNNFLNMGDSIDKNLLYINEQVSLVQKENDKLYKNTQEEILKGLEKNRSDIQMDVRNEGNQIERTVQNTLDKNYVNLEKGIKEKFEEIDNRLSVVNSMLVKQDKLVKVVLGIGSLCLVGILYGVFLR